MHNILALTDRAVAAYLSANGVASLASVYPFKRSLEKELPCVICMSRSGSPVAVADGTYEIEVEVNTHTASPPDVEESEEEPLDKNDAIIDAVNSALHQFGNNEHSGGGLAEAITSAAAGAGVSPFTCQDAEISNISQSIDTQRGEPAWVDTIALRLTVSPSDVG